MTTHGSDALGIAGVPTGPTADLRLDGLAAALCELIDSELSLDPSVPVRPGTDLLLTGLVDSLGVVQIVGWLEDRFGVEIDPMDVVLEHFGTVELMVAFCERLLEAR